ncbi:hypothetical protein GW17_00031276 [Ensete ventricosum]|nr:hypothetical protein GW17_00031276 [Ensete ventricosum]
MVEIDCYRLVLGSNGVQTDDTELGQGYCPVASSPRTAIKLFDYIASAYFVLTLPFYSRKLSRSSYLFALTKWSTRKQYNISQSHFCKSS